VTASREVDPRKATLVRVNASIENHRNPDMTFTMGKAQLKDARDTRYRLSLALGLPTAPSLYASSIQKIRDEIGESFPIWRKETPPGSLLLAPSRRITIDPTGAAYYASLGNEPEGAVTVQQASVRKVLQLVGTSA
jgi:hypothetical protein